MMPFLVFGMTTTKGHKPCPSTRGRTLRLTSRNLHRISAGLACGTSGDGGQEHSMCVWGCVLVTSGSFAEPQLSRLEPFAHSSCRVWAVCKLSIVTSSNVNCMDL